MFAELLYNFGGYQEWSLLLLRFIVATVLLVHGIPKVKNLRQTAESFGAMGFRPGVFWGTLVAVVEAVGGIAIFIGFFAQPFAALFAGQMLVATVWKIKRGQGFVGGYELDLVLMGASLALATYGSGALSVDGYLWY